MRNVLLALGRETSTPAQVVAFTPDLVAACIPVPEAGLPPVLAVVCIPALEGACIPDLAAGYTPAQVVACIPVLAVVCIPALEGACIPDLAAGYTPAPAGACTPALVTPIAATFHLGRYSLNILSAEAYTGKLS